MLSIWLFFVTFSSTICNRIRLVCSLGNKQSEVIRESLTLRMTSNIIDGTSCCLWFCSSKDRALRCEEWAAPAMTRVELDFDAPKSKFFEFRLFTLKHQVCSQPCLYMIGKIGDVQSMAFVRSKDLKLMHSAISLWINLLDSTERSRHGLTQEFMAPDTYTIAVMNIAGPFFFPLQVHLVLLIIKVILSSCHTIMP